MLDSKPRACIRYCFDWANDSKTLLKHKGARTKPAILVRPLSRASVYLKAITTPSAPSDSCNPLRRVSSFMVTPFLLRSHSVPFP